MTILSYIRTRKFRHRRRHSYCSSCSDNSDYGRDDYPDYEPYDTADYCNREGCPNHEVDCDDPCYMCEKSCSDEKCPHGLYKEGAIDTCEWCNNCGNDNGFGFCSWCSRCLNKECKYEEYSPDANGYCQGCWDDLCSDEKCPYGKYKEGWEGKCLECLYPPYDPYDDYSDEPYNDYIEYSPYHDTCGGGCTIPAKGASIPEGHEDTFREAFPFAKRFLQKKLGIRLRWNMVKYTTEHFTDGPYLVPGFHQGGVITISAYGMSSVGNAIEVLVHEATHAFLWRVDLSDQATHEQNEGLCELAAFQARRAHLLDEKKPASYKDIQVLNRSSHEYVQFRQAMETNLRKLYRKATVKTLRTYLHRCRRERRIVIYVVRCYRCQRVGHVARNCRTRCYRCRRVGHVARNCCKKRVRC